MMNSKIAISSRAGGLWSNAPKFDEFEMNENIEETLKEVIFHLMDTHERESTHSKSNIKSADVRRYELILSI